jgi:hypothetical protein
MSDPVTWMKSSYSNGNGNECVEVAQPPQGPVMVRDSKLGESGPVLTLAPAAWAGVLHIADPAQH